MGANAILFGMPAPAAGSTPTVSSAVISAGNTGVTSLVLGFSVSCSIGAGGNGGMTVTPSGGAATLGTPTGFPGSSASWAVTDRYILAGETVTRTYTQPGNGIEATSGGVDLASFTTQAVTNSSTVVAYDLFTRANAGTLGANWTDVLPGLGIVSNQASATGIAVQAISAYTATTPTSNCRQTFTLRSTPSSTRSYATYIRFDSTAGNGYGIILDNGNVTIYEFLAFAGTQLSTAAVSFASGDIVGLEMVGSNLVVYKNGVSVLTASDGTYTTAKPALFGVASSGGGSETIAFDNVVIQNL